MPGNPKTIELAKKLNRSIPLTVGHLHCLWDKANILRADGDLTGLFGWEIEQWAQWSGPDHHFIDALETTGFIRRAGSRRFLCDWKGRIHPSFEKTVIQREGGT
jgi:hypothetical protein